MDLGSDPLLPERFWPKVEKGPDCWTWIGARTGKGYGGIQFRNRFYLAHRISVLLATGVMPGAKEVVLHACDSPPCVRPDHLSVGSQKANLADMKAKGRRVLGRAKITRDQAEETRGPREWRRAAGTGSHLRPRADAHHGHRRPSRLARRTQGGVIPKLIDITTVRTRDGRAVEGNRKAVAAEVLLAVKPQRKKR